MASTKLSALSTLSTPDGSDYLYVATAGGSSHKILLSQVGDVVLPTYHKAAMYASTSVSVPSGTLTQIPLQGVESWSTSGMGDTTNNAIKIIKAGVYRVTADMTDFASNQAVSTLVFSLRLNGTTVRQTTYVGDQVRLWAAIDYVGQFAVNDLLSLAIFINWSGGTRDTDTSTAKQARLTAVEIP